MMGTQRIVPTSKPDVVGKQAWNFFKFDEDTQEVTCMVDQVEPTTKKRGKIR